MITETQGGGIDEVSMTNRCSNDRGRSFENLIMKGCQAYALEGRAVINKVYEPYRCIKKLKSGGFVGQFTGRAEPDFKGVLQGGQAIAFEAKSTKKSRMQHNALTDDQMRWLQIQEDMGAEVFVCIDIAGRFFMLPWKQWRDMKKIYGKKFLMPGDIEEFEVLFDGAVRFLDYAKGDRVDEEGQYQRLCNSGIQILQTMQE